MGAMKTTKSKKAMKTLKAKKTMKTAVVKIAMKAGKKTNAMKAGRVKKVLKTKKPVKASGTAGDLQSFIDETNLEYESVHKAFEDQFWGTKMALKHGDFNKELLTST